MKAAAEAMKTFVSSFGLPAYNVQSIPEDVSVPYLAYSLNEPEWNQKTTNYIQGWYRATSNAELTAKADEIIKAIGTGVTLNTASGYLVIYPETPIVQLMVDGDYRSFYINISINSYQVPGAYPEPQVPDESPEEGETENAET